jgi:hypothetical protein
MIAETNLVILPSAVVAKAMLIRHPGIGTLVLLVSPVPRVLTQRPLESERPQRSMHAIVQSSTQRLLERRGERPQRSMHAIVQSSRSRTLLSLPNGNGKDRSKPRSKLVRPMLRELSVCSGKRKHGRRNADAVVAKEKKKHEFEPNSMLQLVLKVVVEKLVKHRVR